MAAMLYYLDILPVPEHLQAYLQNVESSTLSYSVRTPAERRAFPKRVNERKDDSIYGGKGRSSSALEYAKSSGVFESGTLNESINNNNKNCRIRSLIPRLVRSNSNPSGSGNESSAPNGISLLKTRAGGNSPTLRKKGAGGMPSSLRKGNVHRIPSLKRNNFGSAGSLISKTKSNSPIGTSSFVEDGDLLLHRRSHSNCSTKSLERYQSPTEDRPRSASGDRTRRSRGSHSSSNEDRPRSASAGRRKYPLRDFSEDKKVGRAPIKRLSDDFMSPYGDLFTARRYHHGSLGSLSRSSGRSSSSDTGRLKVCNVFSLFHCPCFTYILFVCLVVHVLLVFLVVFICLIGDHSIVTSIVISRRGAVVKGVEHISTIVFLNI